MEKIIIIGTGGHAKVIFNYLKNYNDNVVGFCDENKKKDLLYGLPVYKSIDEIKDKEKHRFIIAIGNNYIRRRIANTYNLNYYTFIHESALISDDVVIGEGSMIMAGTIINSGTAIGKHVIINTGAIIEHDCTIKNYVHASPRTTICGTCTIGENVWLGAASTIINNIEICNDIIVGSATNVIMSITENGTYIGNPARMLNK